MVRYEIPRDWFRCDPVRIAGRLVEAKAAVRALRMIPHQRAWVEALQKVELKREVAGTSRIEGAEFTERELDLALGDSPEKLVTRSQRQARAAVETYRWIAALPDDRPLDSPLILDIHRRIVTGADDDHCTPGVLRRRDENVTFGSPMHRGVEGGEPCADAFERFLRAVREEFPRQDPVLGALAAHYHIAAMHPFLDGNGRTARAVEALLLQRAGLRDTCFVAMSNYYYEEKSDYLAALAASRAGEHDLTPFVEFALKGLERQAGRLLEEIRRSVSKELYRGLAHDLFGKLRSPKRRVIAGRQLQIIEFLLEREWVSLDDLDVGTAAERRALKTPRKALVRDLGELATLRAVEYRRDGRGDMEFRVRLEWPTEITESKFFETLQRLPKAKSYPF